MCPGSCGTEDWGERRKDEEMGEQRGDGERREETRKKEGWSRDGEMSFLGLSEESDGTP